MCTDIVCYLKYYKCNTFFRILFDTKTKDKCEGTQGRSEKMKSLEKKERKNTC